MYVVVNAAASVDGKLSSRRREQITISGPDDFDRVDELRASSDAVMVGIGTVLADDPHLLTGDPESAPVRVVVDSNGRTPSKARILDGSASTLVLTGEDVTGGRRDALEAAGATVVETTGERVDLVAGLAILEERGIDRLMVEGGGELIFSLFEEGLVDELSVFVGSMVIGGRDAPTLADGEGFVEDFPELSLEAVERVDDGVLLRYRV